MRIIDWYIAWALDWSPAIAVATIAVMFIAWAAYEAHRYERRR